jgi:hypothetical protein
MRLLPALWELGGRIYRHFDTLPARVELVNSRFYTVSNLAQTLAWVVHLSWFFVFHYRGIAALAWFQLFSVACYVAAIVLNRHAHHVASMAVSLGEIVLHQVVAVRFLGPEAAFQFFIPVVAIFPFLLPTGNLFVKSLLMVLCAVSYLGIELSLAQVPPLFPLPSGALLGFKVTNITMGFGFIALWAYYLNLAIARAEVILQARTKELSSGRSRRKCASSWR